MRDPPGLAVIRVLRQAAPVHAEKVGDPAERPLDLSIDVGPGHAAERGRLLRQQGLEAQSLPERQLRPPSAGTLDQEPRAQSRQGHDQRPRPYDVPSVQGPQRGLLVSQDAARREPARVEPPSPELPLVEHVGGPAPVDDGKRGRRLSTEHPDRERRCPGPLGLEAGQAPAHDPMPEVGLRPAVHRHARSASDEGDRFRVREEAPRPVAKERHEQHDAVLRQGRHVVQQARHRPAREIGHVNAVAVPREIVSRGRLQVLVDLRGPGDHHRAPRPRLERERGLERRSPLRR